MCRWQASIERMLGGNIQYLCLHLGNRMINLQWVREKFLMPRKSRSSSLFCHTASPLQVSQNVLSFCPLQSNTEWTRGGSRHSPLPPPILTIQAFTNSIYQLSIIHLQPTNSKRDFNIFFKNTQSKKTGKEWFSYYLLEIHAWPDRLNALIRGPFSSCIELRYVWISLRNFSSAFHDL